MASNTAPSYLHKVEQRTVTKVQAQEVKPPEPVAPAPAPVVEQPKPSYPVSGNRAIGQEMATAKGWTGSQWVCLESLWTKESNWNHLVGNRQGSGAYGIPQALPASKMASYGSDYLTNPRVQIAWGLDYIKNRYGTPCSALAFWNSKSPHWY